MSATKRVLGIEGGGTKTEWIYIACEGSAQKILDRGLLSAANLKLIAESALLDLFRVLPADATHVGAYLAGCGTDADRAYLQKLARSVWTDAEVSVGSDRESGFATAFRDGDGITVIAGTGSAVTGRKAGKIE